MTMQNPMKKPMTAGSLLSRRNFLTAGVAGGLGGGLVATAAAQTSAPAHDSHAYGHGAANAPLGGNITVGTVDHARNGFDPHSMLTDWDAGKVETLADGRRLRDWTIIAADMEIEIAPGVFFPAWTYNGRVPGPTLRSTEGERLRIRFPNGGSASRTRCISTASTPRAWTACRAPGVVEPGEEFTYEFDARPSAATSITATRCR